MLTPAGYDGTHAAGRAIVGLRRLAVSCIRSFPVRRSYDSERYILMGITSVGYILENITRLCQERRCTKNGAVQQARPEARTTGTQTWRGNQPFARLSCVRDHDRASVAGPRQQRAHGGGGFYPAEPGELSRSGRTRGARVAPFSRCVRRLQPAARLMLKPGCGDERQRRSHPQGRQRSGIRENRLRMEDTR